MKKRAIIIASIAVPVALAAAVGSYFLVPYFTVGKPVASQVVADMKARGADIICVTVYSEKSDPNHLMNKLHQYTSCAKLKDLSVMKVYNDRLLQQNKKLDDLKKKYDFSKILSVSQFIDENTSGMSTITKLGKQGELYAEYYNKYPQVEEKGSIESTIDDLNIKIQSDPNRSATIEVFRNNADCTKRYNFLKKYYGDRVYKTGNRLIKFNSTDMNNAQYIKIFETLYNGIK